MALHSLAESIKQKIEDDKMPSDSDELDEFAVPSLGGPSYSNFDEGVCSSFVQVVT